MLRVSVCYVAGPVLCVGSLGVVSVRHARYPYVRADSYVYFTVFYGFVCLCTVFYGFVRPLYGILRIRTSFVRYFTDFVR